MDRKTIIRNKQNIFRQTGVTFETELPGRRENKWLTLILKGIIIFLVTAGSIGGFLSAVGLAFSKVQFYAVLFVVSIVCGLLYYNRLTKYIGYPLFIAVIGYRGYKGGWLVLSGFSAIFNQVFDQLADYMDFDLVGQFAEPYVDRYQTVTAAMLAAGSAACVFTSLLVVRKMLYFRAVCIGMLLFLLPFYTKREPDLLSVLMMTTGMAAVYLFRKNKNYQERTCTKYFRYDRQGKIYCVHNVSAFTGVVLWTGVTAVIFLPLLSILIPKQSYFDYWGDSVWKQKDMALLNESFQTKGNGNIAAGGLSGGRLGNVGRVYFDNETDLLLSFVPCRAETVYVKHFAGLDYVPYDNIWMEDWHPESAQEAGALLEAYLSGNPYSAVAYMGVTNIEAASGKYLPYYTEEVEEKVSRGGRKYYLYFPGHSEIELKIEPPKDMESWLQIPQENQEALEQFCEEAGFGEGGAASDITLLSSHIKTYFQENIPYTLKPGATPSGKDFINYFLLESRKGYCMHFASAAVLIFRHYGIPARYVEGYVVPYAIVQEGVPIPDAKYSAFFEGYSALDETQVKEVTVTDAQAHAWVEIYDSQAGWQVVEVTPSAWEEEALPFSKILDFLDSKMQNLETGQDLTKDVNEPLFPEKIREQTVWRLWSLILLIVSLAAYGILKPVIGWIKYSNAGHNDRLILRYSKFYTGMVKKYPELKGKLHYKDQLYWMTDQDILHLMSQEAECLADILLRAGFSAREITQDEFDLALTYLSVKKRKK